jgi:hypothetical protein
MIVAALELQREKDAMGDDGASVTDRNTKPHGERRRVSTHTLGSEDRGDRKRIVECARHQVSDSSRPRAFRNRRGIGSAQFHLSASVSVGVLVSTEAEDGAMWRSSARAGHWWGLETKSTGRRRLRPASARREAIRVCLLLLSHRLLPPPGSLAPSRWVCESLPSRVSPFSPHFENFFRHTLVAFPSVVFSEV